MRALPLALLSLAFLCAQASAAAQPRTFPLAVGNHWTLRDVDKGTRAPTISIRKGFVLHGFPGAGDLRVRRMGQTVQAWDVKDRRWEAFFRLGAKVGTRYEVELPATGVWQSVEVGVESKTAAVRDYNGHVKRGCTRFVFRQLGSVADAGVLDMAFAPGVGPVRYSETTIAGPRTFALASFKVERPEHGSSFAARTATSATR